MSNNEFKLLTFEQKLSVIDRNGVFLAGLSKDHIAFNLYSLFNFFVELRYNFENDALECITVFSNSFSLDPYLEEIQIPV